MAMFYFSAPRLDTKCLILNTRCWSILCTDSRTDNRNACGTDRILSQISFKLKVEGKYR